MKIFKLFVFFFIIFSANIMTADEIKSTKEGGKWDENSTWIGGKIPTAKDNVEIFGFVSSNNNECNKLIISESGYLNVENGTTRVHSILLNKGHVTVYENSTLKVKEIKNEAKDSFYNFGVIEVGE